MRFSVPTISSQPLRGLTHTGSRSALAGAIGLAMVLSIGTAPVTAAEPEPPVATAQATPTSDDELPTGSHSPDPELIQESAPAELLDAEATEEPVSSTPPEKPEEAATEEPTAPSAPPKQLKEPLPLQSHGAVESAQPTQPPAAPADEMKQQHADTPGKKAVAPSPTPEASPTPEPEPSPSAAPTTESPTTAGAPMEGPGAYMGQGLAMEVAEAAAASRSLSRAAAPQAASAAWIPDGLRGMDVSGWQADSGYTRSTVEWANEWSKGSRFVYVKATEGSGFIDKSRASHLEGATKVGMLHGAYHFALPGQSTATAQADHFVRNGGTWKADGKTLPPLLDIENNPYGANCYGLSQDAMVNWIRTFSNRVLSQTGRLPMIYTNLGWWKSCTGDSKAFSHQPLHIAAYTGGAKLLLPAGWPVYSMWQFSSTGPFAGDSNVWNGTLASLKKFATGTTVSRINGKDRYEVSAAVSKSTFPAGTKTVYVASGSIYTDALSGSAAAGHVAGPVLLTASSVLPYTIRTELKRLKPQKIVVLGGPASVDNSVMHLLKNYAPSVTRMDGKDRYVVSAGLSKSTFQAGTNTAYIASGAIYTDALSGSALAGHEGGPILLTAPNVLPNVIRAELSRLKPQRVVILGGPGTISDSVLTLLKNYSPSVTRVGGQDRYEVSAAVSRANYWVGTKTVYIASGSVYSDALSGSAAAARRGSPVLLTAPNVLPNSIRTELQRIKPERIVILGGPGSVSNGVLNELQRYAR